MGYDLDLFVDAESIPRQLQCAICSGVLQNPVETPCEHLFCEEELLEWLLVNQKCPLDNLPVDPEKVKKPGRVILSLLGELKRYCGNKERGCNWVGELDSFPAHVKRCEFTPPEDLFAAIEKRDKRIQTLEKRLEDKESQLREMADQLELRTKELRTAMASLAVLTTGASSSDEEGGTTPKGTKVRRGRKPGGAKAGAPASPSSRTRPPQQRGGTMSELEAISRLVRERSGLALGGYGLTSPSSRRRPPGARGTGFDGGGTPDAEDIDDYDYHDEYF